MSTKSNHRFREGRDKGAGFLFRQLRPDGGFGNPDAGVTDYYKVPMAFSMSGESAAANKLLGWIRSHGLLVDGDFGPRPVQAKDCYYYAYYNCWIVIGAVRNGHFDLANRGMEFLEGFWDAESGGFYSSPSERKATTLQDLWVTSIGGQAAIYTGRKKIADGVARWMRNLIDQQPDYPKRMYSVCNRQDGLITTVEDNNKIRYLLDVSEPKDQYFFHPGIGAGFLVLHYRSTGAIASLELAEEYMRPAEIACDHLFRTPQAGKVGWAAALLWHHTGKPKYREMAQRVGDNLLAAQQSDGCWSPDQPHRNDFTAEFVVWLDEIHQIFGE